MGELPAPAAPRHIRRRHAATAARQLLPPATPPLASAIFIAIIRFHAFSSPHAIIAPASSPAPFSRFHRHQLRHYSSRPRATPRASVRLQGAASARDATQRGARHKNARGCALRRHQMEGASVHHHDNIRQEAVKARCEEEQRGTGRRSETHGANDRCALYDSALRVARGGVIQQRSAQQQQQVTEENDIRQPHAMLQERMPPRAAPAAPGETRHTKMLREKRRRLFIRCLRAQNGHMSARCRLRLLRAPARYPRGAMPDAASLLARRVMAAPRASVAAPTARHVAAAVVV